jgi:hypothetical protein
MYRACHRNARVLAAVAIAACTSTDSATDLHPEGPPMIAQVRLVEVFTFDGNRGLNRTVFGFGGHPDAPEEEVHAVTTAKAADNRLRIIFDELLRGNNLEEIACRAVVDGDAYDRVPLGATPDDVARCSVAQDVLPSSCPGSNRLSLCLCKLDAGCPIGMTGPTVPPGESVGVQDFDQDGAADTSHFVAGAVAIRCGEIDVALDLVRSYWTPSGNQQKPAQGGFDALGPAVVVLPAGPLPTNLECGLRFAADVVDKDGNRVCAPPGGDITGDCAPGDTSAVTFKVEPLEFAANVLDPGQPRTTNITITANVPLDAASLSGVTVTEAPDTAYTQFVAERGMAPNQISIRWTAPGGLAATTRYTITVTTAVTDTHGQSAPQAFQLAFTTGAN